MGYFSNGTEGALYEEVYCEKCIHYEDCAVLGLHFAYNYDQANKEDSFLHELIPYKDCFNGKCRMFFKKVDQPQEITLLLKDNAALRKKLAAEKKRADAAVEDMKRMDRYIAENADPCAALCEVCRHKPGVGEECRRCDVYDNAEFEWRGGQEGEKE